MEETIFDEDRAAILARRQRFIALALGGLATGCATREVGSEAGTTTVASSTTGETGTESTESSDTTGETETETETETEGGSFVGFVPSNDVCLTGSWCDPFLQDCPQGEKCVPYGSTGGNWDANKCVVVEGEGVPGDPCNYGGTALASDDCDESSYCWDVQVVEDTLTGVCRSFCQGTPDDWLCDEGDTCLLTNEGSVNMCVGACDPLLQACGQGLGCSWTGQDFACIVTVGDVDTGVPCGFANDCAPGKLCVGADATPMCMGSACCVDYCATDAPEPCVDPGLECVSFYAEGEAPAGGETLGLCMPPGACEGEDDVCGLPTDVTSP